MRSNRHRLGVSLLLVASGLGLLTPFSADYGISQPATPEIRAVVIPSSIPAFESARGVVLFSDPQGDVTQAIFHVIDGKFNLFRATMDANRAKLNVDQVKSTDSLIFDVDCAFAEQQVMLRLELIDRRGHRSRPELVTFTCGVPSEANFDKEQSAERPTDRHLAMNLLVLDDGINSLSDGATFPSVDAPLGRARPALAAAMTRQIVPALSGIWDQCGLAFRLDTLAIVRPRHVQLAGITMDERLFVRGDGLPQIALAHDPLEVLTEALVPLGESPEYASRHPFGPNALTVYVSSARFVAEPGDQAQFGGVTYLRGRVSLVRWDAVMETDEEESSAIVLPKRPVTAIAHEFGHNFGLQHVSEPSDRDNLMFADPDGRAVAVPPQPPVGLTATQCTTARAYIEQSSLAAGALKTPNQSSDDPGSPVRSIRR